VMPVSGEATGNRLGMLKGARMAPFERNMRRQLGFSFLDTPAPRDLPLWPRAVTTDAQGRYEIRGFGRDQDVELLVEDDHFATQKLILDTGSQEKPKEFVRALAPPQKFEGKVVYDDTGMPAPKVWVAIIGFRNFQGQEIGTYTDARGRFKINPFPGDYF